MSTPDLVEKAQAGDTGAFSALMGEYGYRLGSLVYLRLGSRFLRQVEPQDVLQEVWTRALESLNRFECRGKDSFFQWLGSIADHVVADLKRRQRGPRGRQKSLEEHEARSGELAGPDEATPSGALRREERFQRLLEALEKLSPDHREVIILARVRGLPTADIAVIMDRTPGAVRVLLFRALKELRVHFGSTDSFHLPPRSLEGPGAAPRAEAVDGTSP